MVVAGGARSVAELTGIAMAKDFVREQHRHCKTLLALDDGAALFDAAGIPPSLPSGAADPGIVTGTAKGRTVAVAAFAKALARHRHYERETDPPSA